MLVNFNEMLKKAKEEHYAIPHFNINNLEWTKYILEQCQALNVPVILGVSSQTAKYMGGWSVPVAFTKALINELELTIPICLHVDHGSLEECKRAIDAGFPSVMIDASKYDLEENIRITKEVVDYAHIKNVSVEAEIGSIGLTTDNKEAIYASLEDCITLYKETHIDALAPAIGSAHGIYTKDPQLNFDRLREISNSLPIPLVLHGGSGIPDEELKKAIIYGISKINVNTDLQVSWSNDVKSFIKDNNNVYDPRKIISSGQSAIANKITELIKLFGTKNSD